MVGGGERCFAFMPFKKKKKSALILDKKCPEFVLLGLNLSF